MGVKIGLIFCIVLKLKGVNVCKIFSVVFGKVLKKRKECFFFVGFSYGFRGGCDWFSSGCVIFYWSGGLGDRVNFIWVI